MERSSTVLVVDDDPDVTDLLEAYLESEGYVVHKAPSALQMWEVIEHHPVDLVLLDIKLPDGNGFDLTKEVRAKTDAAIIIISKKRENVDQIIGLELGADDYVVKPFDPRNLLARIRSVLRRYSPSSPQEQAEAVQTVAFGSWTFNPATYRLLSAAGEETTLSSSESALLSHLLQNAGQVLSRDDLTVAISGRNWEYMDRTIDILIARLRKRIEPNPARPTVIKTVRGAGYVFSNEALKPRE